MAGGEKWRGIKHIATRPEGMRLTKRDKSASLLHDGSVECVGNKKRNNGIPLLSSSPSSSEPAACQPLKTDEGNAADADTRLYAADRNGCIKGKGRKHHSRRRVRR